VVNSLAAFAFFVVKSFFVVTLAAPGTSYALRKLFGGYSDIGSVSKKLTAEAQRTQSIE
jgi:ABC-type phosphate transport system substrate-binding protein